MREYRYDQKERRLRAKTSPHELFSRGPMSSVLEKAVRIRQFAKAPSMDESYEIDWFVAANYIISLTAGPCIFQECGG